MDNILTLGASALVLTAAAGTGFMLARVRNTGDARRLDDAKFENAVLRDFIKSQFRVGIALTNKILDLQEKLDTLSGVVKSQDEALDEDETETKDLATELTAVRSAANDDAADADRFAEQLIRADEVIHFYQQTDATLPDHLLPAVSEANARISLRTNADRGPGVAGRESEIAA